MSSILAIDQGTSGTKAMVVDDEGRVRSLVEATLRPDYLPGGGVEQDPDALLDSVLSTGQAAVDQAGVPIDAVGLSNQGETVLAWDEATGKSLTPLIVWQDSRAESICQRLRGEAETIAQRTGLVLDPYFTAPKQAWLRENLCRDGVVTTSDTWLVHRLTGEFVTDLATASRSLVLDLDSGTWDAELVDMFGLGSEELPRIVANDVAVGETSAFGPSVPMAGLVVDQQAALLAESCLAPGEAKCTFGTGAFLLANTGPTPLRSTCGLAACVAWRARDVTSYCFDGQVYTAASAVRWLQDLGLIAEPADLDRLSAPTSGGVVCVPALAGLAAPWWRSDATATLAGMSLSSERGHLVRAVVDGLAAQVAQLADLMAADQGRPMATLRVDGGLTRSRVLMQAVADLAQVEVEVYPSPHATALGVVALARAALSPATELSESIVEWRASERYSPHWTAQQAADARGRFLDVLTANLTKED